MFVSSVFLADIPIYKVFVALQLFGYALATLGGLMTQLQKRSFLLGTLYSFLIANVGMFLGLITFLSGRRIAIYGKPE